MSSSHAPLTRNSRVSETSHRYRRPVASHDAPARSVPIMCRGNAETRQSGSSRTTRAVRIEKPPHVNLVDQPPVAEKTLQLLQHVDPELLRDFLAAVQNAATPKQVTPHAPVPDKLDLALAKARKRGAQSVAEILSGPDMRNADEFAALLGVSRQTVNTQRKKGLILGLQGSTRNVRFPDWQIGENGVVLSGLADLFDALGPDPWSVYRFLIQTHPALGGVSARDALNAGLTDRVIDLAHDIARGAVT